jgi:methionyl-tRNA synthetase
MPDTPKFYLTTPIYYVNARPHIGHAYTTIAADVIARRHRLLGDDTFFLTGTDEHGQKIERSAAAAGIAPQLFADQVAAAFEGLWKRMGITNDQFIRTTDPRHKRGVQKLFTDLWDNGFIYLDSYTGAYCVSDETFVDVSPGAPCPDCGRITETVTEANFFFRLSAFQRPLLDLIESGTLRIENDSRRNEVLSFLTGPVSLLEKNGFVDVPANPGGYRDGTLLPGFPPTLRVTALRSTAKGTPYVPGALKDLSVSRSSFTWGIPVPEEIAKIARQPHIVYVWLDALANYMTAVGYGSEDPDEQEKFARYWPADLHLVGKEIIRFHCVYWPAFLLALNPALMQPNAGLPQDKNAFALSPDPAEIAWGVHRSWAEKWLPKSIIAHGWLLFEDSKMSKSRGNIVRTETILDAFGDEVYGKQFPESTKAERDLFAADVLRYFLLREIPFGQDGSFSFDALITRYNADLTNGYGNLVSRTLNLLIQNFSSGIPEAQKPWLVASLSPNAPEVVNDPGLFLGTDLVIKGTVHRAETIPSLLGTYRFHAYIFEVLLNLGEIDAYLTAHKPWILAKSDDPTDRKKLVEILYTAAESIRIITALLYPVMPYATASVWRQLGLGSIEEAARNGELKNLQWGGLKPGTKLGPLAPIFPRADKGLAQIMTDMENPTTPPPAEPAKPDAKSSEPTAESLNAVNPATAPPAPAALAPLPAPTDNSQLRTENSPLITIDDFAKIDLRVAQIVVAERIPKADKLLRLEVDLGTERRQILSGIAEFYTPEELIGKRIAIIANLAPRKMRGLESHGMLLAASGEDHSSKPILATFSDEIALGSKIR